MSIFLAVSPSMGSGESKDLPGDAPAPRQDTCVIPINSPAFFFSPGNWTGDAGRAGSLYRQTWYSGAYFRVSWSTAGAANSATILLDTDCFGMEVKHLPQLTYSMDGVWKSDVPCREEIPVEGLAYPGEHTLVVYLQNSEQANRWGSPGKSGSNVLRVRGLRVDAGSTPVPSVSGQKWILEVGDSITEGVGTDGNLSAYSYFIGQALQTQGYEYSVSACGWSGWICRGDRLADVPAYYCVSASTDGKGGVYDEGASRWNKIDANHSLLDSKGHLSAYGQQGEEPSIITINYGTNEAISQANKSDLQASITHGLGALRGAAPAASIFVIVPFGQFNADVIRAAVAAYQTAHPDEQKVMMIDLGPKIRRGMSNDGYWSGIHPNLRGHATFAAQIVAALQAELNPASCKILFLPTQ